jgi:hypothetical protein
MKKMANFYTPDPTYATTANKSCYYATRTAGTRSSSYTTLRARIRIRSSTNCPTPVEPGRCVDKVAGVIKAIYPNRDTDAFGVYRSARRDFHKVSE